MNGLVDIRTASLCTGVVGVIFCLYLGYVYRTRKTYPGFQQWTLSSLSLFSSMILIYLREVLPDWAAIAGSNLLAVVSLVLIARGIAAFTARPIGLAAHVIAGATAVLVSVIFTYVWPDVRGRIVPISLISCLILGQCISLARAAAVRQRLPVGWLVLSLGLLVGCFVLRMLLTLLYEPASRDFMSASSIQGLMLVLYSACNIGIFLGLLVLNSHRTEAELQQALEEVRTLQGIIPICSTCKKIRDDRGAWNQLESYISRHSQARFSHGYCPDCVKKVMATLP